MELRMETGCKGCWLGCVLAIGWDFLASTKTDGVTKKRAAIGGRMAAQGLKRLFCRKEAG